MVFDPTTRQFDNKVDAKRTFPTTALSPAVMSDGEGTVVEKITGPGASLAVKLSRPAAKIGHIISYTTATGVGSTGGSKKTHLALTTDYTFVGKDPTGVCAITNAAAVDYSAETWVVFYSPLTDDATIGGRSSAHH